MKTSGLAIVLVALCACSKQSAPTVVQDVSLASVPLKPDSGSLAIQCGKLVDGLATHAFGNTTVIIRDGRIASVDSGFTAPNDLAVLNLREYMCLPGLIDMHTHITESFDDTVDMTIYLRRTAEEQAAMSSKHVRETLLAGFTSVRNVGNYDAWQDRNLRDAINAGTVIGPRIQAVGFYLTISNGGGDLGIPGMKPSEIPDRFHMGVAQSPEEFRTRAQAAIDGGADVLKVIASGAVLAHGGVPGSPEVEEPALRAIAEVAHASNKKLAAHAHGAESIKQAIRAGADTIEHASLIDDEGIALAREHGVALAMDVYNGTYIDTEGRKQQWPEEFLRKNLETTEAQRQAFTKAHAAGATIVFATDAGVYPHGQNALQFPIMVERGMTPMEAIQSATSVAAKYMGWEDQVGAIAAGRLGDVIAVKGDPLEDITHLQNVAADIKGGLLFKKPAE